MKKIAVASDGAAVSLHFGRCKCFVVFEVEDGKVVGSETRPNAFTAHALGQCEPEHDHEHSHEPIVSALADCSLVLCRGMGWHAAEELRRNGIEVAVLGEEMTPDEAIAWYLEGKPTTGEGFCQCHE